MPPGAVVLWNDGRPCVVVHRIPGKGITLEHTCIELGASGVGQLGQIFEVWAESNARVELNGRRLTAATSLSLSHLPAFIAAGPMVIALVEDIEPFERVASRDDGFGSGLGPVIDAVDAATNAEEHLSLKGSEHVTRGLATRYADKLGTHAWFRPGGDQHLDHFLSTRRSVRTVILELSRPLLDYDVRSIGILLETDLRFVVVRADDHYLQWLPSVLAERTIEVPGPGCDERVKLIASRAGERALRATTVASLLDQGERLPEARWNELVGRVVDDWSDDMTPDVAEILRSLG